MKCFLKGFNILHTNCDTMKTLFIVIIHILFCIYKEKLPAELQILEIGTPYFVFIYKGGFRIFFLSQWFFFTKVLFNFEFHFVKESLDINIF